MQEESASEKAEETAGAKAETDAAQPEAVEKQPKQKKSRLQEFLERVTRILLIAVGIGAIFFFGGLFSACAALDLPEIAGMACAEPVK